MTFYIDGELVVEGDATGPRSAQTVLSDPSVEIAVLETARGGIVRCGLGYDWSDISVIRMVRDGELVFTEKFLTRSNRRISLYGGKS